MDFIFMLTEHDQTVPNCLEVMENIAGTGLSHIGCKEVGIEREALGKLVKSIKGAGVISYLELVSTNFESCTDAVEMAVDVGIDRLLGGLRPVELQEICRGRISYYPFPGIPEGHPTKLRGTPEQVSEHCRQFTALGYPGVDLLAYRAVDADPLDLVRAARSAMDGYVICAGSVDSPERIRALADAGANAFTIGSAVFDGSFSPGVSSIEDRVKCVLDATPE